MRSFLRFVCLCFLVLTTTISTAQVIVTELNVILDDHPFKFEYDLDFNNDGQVDFTMQFQNGTTNSSVYLAHVGSYNNNEVVCPAYLDVTVFEEGDIIGPSSSGWFNTTGDYDPSGYFKNPRLAYKFWFGGNTNGNFVHLSNKYIGVRFFLDGNTYYGYIEVSCLPDPQPGFLQIHSIAYESVPDTEIEAGAGECMTQTYYQDNDGDGFGDASSTIEACSAPNGYVDNDTDCDDSNSMINPDAEELCNDIDDNCNGLIDDGAGEAWFEDLDGDGYGNAFAFIFTCDPPAGYVDNNGDCNDSDPLINEGQLELCNGIDDDCNGSVDDGLSFNTWFADTDGDGFGDPNESLEDCEQPAGYVDDNTDCDDSNNQIYPGAIEICNGIDDNCDGQIDEDVLPTWYLDADGDSFGDIEQMMQSCVQPDGYVDDNTDCDDSNFQVFPGAMELCNGIDDNCNGLVDEGLNPQLWFADVDGDGYGDSGVSMIACEQPNGYVQIDGDCNDNDVTIYPNAPELCNGIDDNCNGSVDEDLTIDIWYADSDGDGFGDDEVSVEDCAQPDGYVLMNGDCDDTDASVYPMAEELCNGVDDNCDGQIDEEIQVNWYQDADGDGFGNMDSVLVSCEQPNGYVEDNTDCDDSNEGVFPGAMEVCNGIDDNCNGEVDEGYQIQTWYEDNDGDGFGNVDVSIEDCSQPTGYVLAEGDCNDSDASIFPTAEELCNGIDDNCDGMVDNDITNVTFYYDGDGDGFGNDDVTIDTCAQPLNYVLLNGDCNDENEFINPNMKEICNGVDDNCDGVIDDSSLMIELFSEAVSAIGNADGSVWVTVEGGEGPYSFLWNTTSTDSLVNNLGVGDYSVVVTDYLNCIQEGTVSVLGPLNDSLEIFISIEDVLCYEDCNGVVRIDSITGGTPPYDYVWEDGFDEGIRESLCAGTYAITFSDVNNFQNEIQFEVLEPLALQVELNPDSSYTTSGGTLPIMESNYWYDAPFFYVEVEDANGCQAQDSLLISSNVEQDVLNEIHIYPTIARNMISIDYPIGFNLNKVKISVYGIEGYLNKTFKAENNLNIEDLSPGVYILRFDYEGESVSKRIVIIN